MDSYYDDISEGYDKLYGEEQIIKLNHSYDEIEDFVPGFFENVKTILDVGCGTGISSDFFAKEGYLVTGIDPSKKLLEQNRYNISKFLESGAEAIPFPDNSFDLVISYTAIQNFNDVGKGLEEIKRVGKGKFILTFLKNVKNAPLIHQAITGLFDNAGMFEDDKERYYVISNA